MALSACNHYNSMDCMVLASLFSYCKVAYIKELCVTLRLKCYIIGKVVIFMDSWPAAQTAWALQGSLLTIPSFYYVIKIWQKIVEIHCNYCGTEWWKRYVLCAWYPLRIIYARNSRLDLNANASDVKNAQIGFGFFQNEGGGEVISGTYAYLFSCALPSVRMYIHIYS